MDDGKWERYAAGSGLVGAALLLIQAFATGIPPGVDDPAPAIAVYYSVHRVGVQVQLVLSAIGVVFLVWFIGSLVGHLRKSEGEPARLSTVALAGWLLATAAFTVGTVAAALLALETGRVEPAMTGVLPVDAMPAATGAVRVLADLRWLAYTASWVGTGPAAAAVAVVSMRHGAFPKWHANASYALFFLAILSGAGIVVSSGPFAPGNAVGYVTFLAFLVWIGATSALLARPRATASEG